MSRAGTRKSRAPSGVGFDRMGVSTSRETLLVEVIARGFGDAMPEAEVARHLRAPEIEIAIFEAQVFVCDLGIELEGQHICLVQDREFGGDDLDPAGLELRVDRALEAGSDLAVTVITSSLRKPWDCSATAGYSSGRKTICVMPSRSRRSMKMTPPWDAARIDPAAQGDFRAGVGWAQGAAMVRTVVHGKRRPILNSFRCSASSASGGTREPSPRPGLFRRPRLQPGVDFRGWKLAFLARGQGLDLDRGPFVADHDRDPCAQLLRGLELLADLGRVEGKVRAPAGIPQSLHERERLAAAAFIGHDDVDFHRGVGRERGGHFRGGTGGFLDEVAEHDIAHAESRSPAGSPRRRSDR